MESTTVPEIRPVIPELPPGIWALAHTKEVSNAMSVKKRFIYNDFGIKS